jgi:beta-phosphoglucomutase-like phosphatase (HAD superfamily)
MIKCIFFDFDGVLVDTKDAHYNLLNQALLSMNYDIISYSSHLTTFDGLPTSKKLKILVDNKLINNTDVEKISNTKQQLTDSYVKLFTRISATTVESLKKLKEDGYRLAITSNCSRITIDAVLMKMTYPLFELVVSKDDVINPKPSDEMYIRAMNYFGVSAGDCVIVDDLYHAEVAASKCGMKFIKINNMNDDLVYGRIVSKLQEFE